MLSPAGVVVGESGDANPEARASGQPGGGVPRGGKRQRQQQREQHDEADCAAGENRCGDVEIRPHRECEEHGPDAEQPVGDGSQGSFEGNRRNQAFGRDFTAAHGSNSGDVRAAGDRYYRADERAEEVGPNGISQAQRVPAGPQQAPPLVGHQDAVRGVQGNQDTNPGQGRATEQPDHVARARPPDQAADDQHTGRRLEKRGNALS